MTRRTWLGALASGAAALFVTRRTMAQDQAQVAALPFRRVTVNGAHALTEWERLRATGDGWPVIVGNDDDLARLADQFVIGDTADTTEVRKALAAATRLRFPVPLDAETEAWLPEAPTGEWPAPDKVVLTGMTVHLDVLSNKPFKRLHILVLPTRHGWEVPAYLRWGGWNECPPAEVHVAALRHWHERYGVELIGLNGDTMNLRATRRPRDRAEALALAGELYRYSPDIVLQGVGTVTHLAAALMVEDWWYFWWD